MYGGCVGTSTPVHILRASSVCVYFMLLIALASVCNNRDLAPKGDGRSDPFATIFFDREQYSTQVSLYTVQQLGALKLSPWHTVLRSHPPPLYSPLLPQPTTCQPPFTHHPSHTTLHTPHSCSWCYCQVMQKTRFPRWKKTFELMVPQTSQGAGSKPDANLRKGCGLQLWYLLTEPVHGAGWCLPAKVGMN